MISLVKNEMYKILHKKAIYVVAIIALAGALLVSILDKSITNSVVDLNTMLYEEQLKTCVDIGEPIDIQHCAHAKAGLEQINFIKEKKIVNESKEMYVVRNDLYDAQLEYYALIYSKADESAIEPSKKKVDEAIELINNYDAIKYINTKMEEAKAEQVEACSDPNSNECIAANDDIVAIQYRIDNNIPYSYNDASSSLDSYSSIHAKYLDVRDKNDKFLDYNEIIDKRNSEATYKTAKYMLDNKILTNDYKDYSSGSELVDGFKTLSFFVILIIIMLSATNVADEFNKGTIKQLLVKPFSRTKILVSKLIAVFAVSVIFMFIIEIGINVIAGLVNGDIHTIIGKQVIFNYHTHEAMYMNTIVLSLYAALLSLPRIILLELFIFTMSVITTNAAFALGLGFGAYISEEVFAIFMKKFPFLSYSPTLNYQFNDFAFGAISPYKDIFLTKSIIVSVVSFVVLLTVSIIVFNKKDIKNQ